MGDSAQCGSLARCGWPVPVNPDETKKNWRGCCHHHRTSVGSASSMVMLADGFPPVSHAVACKLRRIPAHPDVHVSFVQADVIQAMRNDFSLAVAGKVMIQNFNSFLGIELASSVEVADHFFFLGIHADHRLAL